MTTAFTLILTYVLGGLTFIPLCIAAFIAFLFYTSPVVFHPPAPSPSSTKPDLTTQSSDTKSKEVNEEDQEPVTVYRAGWITARRSYEPQLNTNSDGTYVGMLTSGYRSFMDNRSKDPRRSKPKDRFFAVLKQNILFLYESEEQQECWAAIEVSSHDVVVYPEGNVDGEFWVKRTAIELKPKARTEEDGKEKKKGEGDGEDSEKLDGQAEGLTYDPETGKPLPWFIFAKVNSDKEDWYHSLVVASRIGTPTCASETAKDRALFSSDDMSHLVDSIDSLPDSIPMRWFNALLGRIFLSVYRTSSLESYITSRIVRKLKRVKIPSMLSEIQVREVDVGSSTPLFSKPMLKELTPDGEASMECHVSYVGAVRITIETVATVSISSRFKPYSVRLVLAVVLEELEGTLLLKIKKPPSNRIWFGFTSMPKIKMAVEPVVSTRQLKWSLVTSPIESRIREVIAESIVVPHMDDLSFFSTLPFPATARGGIFGAALRKERPDLNVPASSSDTTTKGETDLMSLVEGGEEEGALEDEGQKEKARELEGVLISEGKETVEKARQRVRRHSNSSMIEEEGGYYNPALEARSPTKKPSSIKSTNSAASTSVSSLAGLASARLASWREKKDEQYAGSSEEAKEKLAAEKKRSSSWFTKSNPTSPAPPHAGGLVFTPSNSSLASLPQVPPPATKRQDSTSSASTTASSFLPLNETDAQPPASTSAQQQEVSAAKLREILTQRAESRDRERKENELALIEAEQKLAEKKPVDDSPQVAIPPPTAQRQPSNLSLTAPSDSSASLPLISFDAASPSPASSVIPSQVPLPSSSPDLTATTTAPPLPNRPAWIKPTDLDLPTPVAPRASLPPPPPPIRRSPSHNASASVDSPSSAIPSNTTASLLSSWRAKAADKEALAQSVLQAKESMRKWGAGWNARRTAGRPADAEGAGLMQETTPTKEEDQEDYRDYRKRAKSGLNEPSYYGPSESREASPPISPRRPSHTKSQSTASPSRMRASSTASTHSTLANANAHFDLVSSSSTSSLSAVQPQLNTSKPLPVPSPSTSPSKPAGLMGGSPAGGGYGYRPATMMQLPGIRDESRKKLVSEDHLGGGAAIVETKKEGSNGKEKMNDDSTITLAKSDVTVVPIPSETVHQEIEKNKVAPPSLPPRQPETSTPAPLPALPPRIEEAVQPLPLVPPRPVVVDELEPAVVAPPSLPPRSKSPAQLETTASDPPPTTSNGVENLADEAGWGIEEGEAGGEGTAKER